MHFYGGNLSLAVLVPSHPLAQILIVCFVFGGFGGWVAHCINNERQYLMMRGAARQQSRSAGGGSVQELWFLFPSAFQSAAIGAAGAIGFLFFVIAVGGLTTFADLTEQLRSIAVSVIAGFGARRLLPRMVGHLERQMEQVKLEAEKASHDAKEALEKQQKAEQELEKTQQRLIAVELNEKLNVAARPKAAAQHVEEALRLFTDARTKGTARASVWINAARVQRWHRSLEEAIATLDAFLAAVEQGTVNKDANYAAAYYNKACYYWLRFQDKNDPADRDHALGEITLFLEKTDKPLVEIAEIRKDSDLNGLSELDAFRALASKYDPPSAS